MESERIRFTEDTNRTLDGHSHKLSACPHSSHFKSLLWIAPATACFRPWSVDVKMYGISFSRNVHRWLVVARTSHVLDYRELAGNPAVSGTLMQAASVGTTGGIRRNSA
jgi:hypothetical protein